MARLVPCPAHWRAGIAILPKRKGQRNAAIAWARCSSSLQINLVQKWLGHAQLTTMAIYANAVGAEEKDIARRMWG